MEKTIAEKILEQVKWLVRLETTPRIKNTNGSETFQVLREGAGLAVKHSPTQRWFPTGTVLRNSAGWFLVLEADGTVSSYAEMPQ